MPNDDLRASFIAAAAAAASAKAAADFDASGGSVATAQNVLAQSETVSTGPEPVPGGPAVDQSTEQPATTDSVSSSDPVSTTEPVPHPVFGFLDKLEKEIVGRSSDEVHKLLDYVRSVREHVTDFFKVVP